MFIKTFLQQLRHLTKRIKSPSTTEHDVDSSTLLKKVKQLEAEREQLIIAQQEQQILFETLGLVGLVLNSTLDLLEVLNLICRESVNIFGVDRASVWLIQGDELVEYAGHGPGHKELVGKRVPLTNYKIFGSRIVHQRRPQFINGPSNFADLDPDITGTFQIKAILGVPLITQQDCLGTLILADNRDENRFNLDDVKIATSLGTYAAIAIQNAQLYKAEKEQRELAEALRQAGLALTATLEFDQMLDLLLEQIGQVVPYDTANLLLVKNGQIRVARMRGYEQFEQEVVKEIADFSYKLETTPNLRYMAETGQPMVISNTAEYPNWINIDITTHIRSWAGAPIIIKEQVVAFFSLDKNEAGFYRPEHAQHLAMFTSQAALAFETARLFNAEAQRRREAEILHQASTDLISALEIEAVLENILTHLAQVVPYDSACIFLRNHNRLTAVAAKGFSDPTKIINKSYSADNPLFKEISQSQQPVHLSNAQDDWRFKRWGNTKNIHGWLGVPLVLRNHVIGCLTLDHHQIGAYDQVDIALVKTFANQAAAAIDTAQLLEQTQSALEETEALYHISGAMIGVAGLTDLLQTITQKVSQVLPATWAVLATLDLATQQVLDIVANGPETNITATSTFDELMDGLTGWAIQEMQPALSLKSMMPDPRESRQVQQNRMAKKFGSIIVVPLQYRDEILGTITAINHLEQPDFTQRDINLMMALANQAAVAIQNARLFDDVNQRLTELDVVRQVGLSLTSSLELQTVLESILENIFNLTKGIHNTHIFLYQNEQLIFGTALWQDGVKREPFSNPRPNGLTYTVAQRGEPIYVSDMQNHPLFANAPIEWRGAIMGLPLKIGRRVVGVMNIAYSKPRSWADTELRVIHLLADQAAIAIENARLFEAEQEARQKAENFEEEAKQNLALITRLYELSTEFTSVLSVEEVAHLVIDKVVQATQSHSASLSLMDAYGRYQQVFKANEPVPRPKGTTMTIAKTGQPLTVNYDQSAKMLHPELIKRGIKSVIGLPLKAHQLTIGVLIVRYDQPRQFSEREVEMLYIFAGQAAIAIQNARHHEQEQAQQKRIQQQERMAAVGQLAAGIAHDFNNILTSIIGYAELLAYEPTLSDSAKQDIQRITGQGKRAASLVKQILDFSRQTISAKYPLNFLIFLEETIDLLERTIPEDINISLIVQPGDYTILADATQLQQCLTNLAVNARDAMPNGGKLNFNLSTFLLPPQQEPPIPDMLPGSWILCKISDTGCGIPPESLDRIFEPFFTTKEVGQGTGLGLAQVYGIVQQHEGFIDVVSQVDEGATFKLYLPATPIPSQKSRQNSDIMMLPQGHNKQLLLVEDDYSVITVLTTMLKELGYRVLTAANGREGLELYKEHQNDIALVLTDMTMPEMGGSTLTLALHNLNPDIKIVVLTGYPLTPEAKEMLTKGIVDWLQKPVSFRNLAHVLNRHLQEENLVS